MMDDPEPLKQIFTKFEVTAKKLVWSDCNFDNKDVIDLLNRLPNLEELIINDSKLKGGDEFESELKLTKLKSIVMSNTCPTMTNFFGRYLPKNILKHFEEYSDSRALPKDFNAIIQNQSNINKLIIFCPRNTKFPLLDNLRLTHLNLRLGPANVKLPAIIQNQPHLVDVRLESTIDYGPAFKQICRLEKLEHLTIDITVTSPALFKENIHKLAKLKSLDVSSNDGGTICRRIIEDLGHYQSDRLERLTLNLHKNTLTSAIIIRMSENFPSLKYFDCNLNNDENDFCATILCNFKNLETFKIEFNGNIESNFNFTQKNVKKVHLTLHVLNGFGEMIRNNFLDALPNLEMLFLKSLKTPMQHGLIDKLVHHPKLKSLYIDFHIVDSRTVIDQLSDLLKLLKKLDHAKISFLKFPRQTSYELQDLLEEYRSEFDKINVTLIDQYFFNMNMRIVLSKNIHDNEIWDF